jgi:glycosyltransferase involved in cell wall biosynthesis
MRKPSVLFINRVYPPDRGATGRMLRDLAQAFARDGWDVTVLVSGPKKASERDGAVKIVRSGQRMRRKNLFGYLNTWLGLLMAALKLPAHDLVVTMTDPPLLVTAGSVVAKFKKSKHIHWCQDLYPELLPVLGYEFPESLIDFFSRVTRRAMNGCDRVIVVGRCMARALIHRGMDSRHISVIPNWPDSELTDTRAPASEPLPMIRPMNVRPSEELFRDAVDMKFRILYAGTLGRAHPVDTVLDAAALLQQTHPDIEFVFVGNGPRYAALAAERGRRGLDNVKLLPWQPASRLRELMESGDVHLITMNPDAAGLLVPSKMYSALAANRPCILVGPEHSEVGRVLNDFGAGAVVSHGDAPFLAHVIRCFREDSQLWYDGREGAAKAGELFMPSESMKLWLERARAVVGTRAGGIGAKRILAPANTVRPGAALRKAARPSASQAGDRDDKAA